MVIAALTWAWLDNRKGHKEIYDKLHADHQSLSVVLMEMKQQIGELIGRVGK